MPASQTDLKEYGEDKKTKVLFFFSYQCSHCINSMENIKALQRYSIVDTIIPIALYTDSMPQTEYRDDIKYLYFEPIEIRRTTASFIKYLPTTFIVINDTIVSIYEGSVPAPSCIFRDMTTIKNIDYDQR